LLLPGFSPSPLFFFLPLWSLEKNLATVNDNEAGGGGDGSIESPRLLLRCFALPLARHQPAQSPADRKVVSLALSLALPLSG